MNRMKRKWTSLIIAFTMLATLLTPTAANAAGPRIDISSPFAATNVTTGLPLDNNAVPRFTSQNISITANIQNITDAQVAGIYYEITNVKTNPINNVTSVVKSNPAIHAPGTFTITFNNVELTEGLNQITVKMGDTNIVSSAPSWAYFTPTTNITNLTANGVPFSDTQSYPANPASTSIVTISGQAANATSVEVTMGNSSPKTVFLNNGTFFFTADNKPNSTSTFHVNSGDNPLTIVAKNNTKSYQLVKNLIYDDGNPFAFNANITTTYATGETVSMATSTNSNNLTNSNVAAASVEVWTTAIKSGGTKLQNFTVKKDPANPLKSFLAFTAAPGTAYAFYSYGVGALLSTPTTTTTNVQVSANLKDDITPLGLKYRFVDIIAGGSRFGPYDLSAAAAATTAQNNGLYPTAVNQGYSTGTVVGIQGTGLGAGVALKVTVADNTGANAITLGTFDLGSSVFTNSSGTMVFFKLPDNGTVDALTNAKSPYKLTISNGATVLNNYTLTVNNLGPIALVTNAAITGLKAGYAASAQTVTLTGTTVPGGGLFAAGSLRVDVTDLTGQNILLTANAISTAASAGNTDFSYTLPIGLLAGDYKMRVSYAGSTLIEKTFSVAQADPTLPTVNQPLTPVNVPNLAAPTYIVVTGANLGTNIADITTAGLYDTGTSNLKTALTPYILNDTTAIFKLGNQASLTAGATYDLKFSKYVRTSSGAIFPSVPSPYVLTVTGVVKSQTLSGISYGNETVTDIAPLQMTQASIASTNLTITGVNLLDKTKMFVEVLNQDGASSAGTGLVTSNDTVNGLQALATLPALTAGAYIVRISYNGNVLAQSALSIASPSIGSINPTLMYNNQWTPTKQMTVTGTGFGLDPSKLSLNLVSDATGQVSTQNVVTYPTGITSSMAHGNSGVTEVRPVWNMGFITAPGSGTSQTFTFDSTTVTIVSAAATTGTSGVTGTTSTTTVANGSNAAVYASALLNALNAMKAVGGSPLASYTFALNALGDGLIITGIAGVGATKNSMGTTGSNLTFSNSAAIASNPSTLGVTKVAETDTATVNGPATADGQFTVTIAGAGLPLAGITSGVIPVVNGSSAAANTTNISAALTSALAGYYTLSPSGSTILFTQVNGTAGPALTMKINSQHSLTGASQVIFPLPNLPQGSYQVSLLNNGIATGTSLQYTVAPPQPSLQENAGLSVQGQYKVFDFSALISIPTSRDQIVQFKFYNFSTDTLPPTTFSYHYVDPNLPYIDRSILGLSQPLSELTTNTIGEMPNSLYVYANLKTTKINLYTGTYNSGAAAYATITSYAPDPTLTYNIFTIPLTNLPNGATQFTIIPSNNNSVGSTAQQGENLTGKKVYDINIASTPYLIVNNLFTGMVVKNPLSEITCTTSSGALIPGCISGRVVNIPLAGWPAAANIEMYVNGNKSNFNSPTSSPSDFDPLLSTFHIQFDAAHGGPLKEGKNTISFYIYVAGVLATQSSFDVFVFSTTAPEFQVVKPIETTDIPKFILGAQQDTYSTSETAVTFTGQFINATDLKLTVKQTDATGKQVSSYDRRVSTSSLPDPLVGNPGYLNAVNFLVSPLSFFTNPINLATKGNTIFEFTITNSSNVTITKTITIKREPLPYVVVYPALSKNAKGADQANINSNYVEIEMIAENADSVNFGGKNDAVKRQVVDKFGNLQTHFFYEEGNLKAGANSIKFTVLRGAQKSNGTFILFNANTTVEGAQYKTLLNPSMKVYNGNIELKFPSGTNLMRNDTSALNQYLTSDRKILFGIANNLDGRVDKYKNPAATDGQLNNPNPVIPPNGKLLLSEPTGRFKPASSLYWIDAGTIANNETDQTKALTGGGKLPYDTENFFSRGIKDLVVPSKRGTLTLKYDPNIRSDAWKYITVYHYDIFEDYTGSTQFRWRNLGGVVDAAKNTITVPFETFGYYQVMYMGQSFDDVTSHPWARNQLDTLYAKGVMVNKSNTAFVPNDNISRGEFTALLVKIFDIQLQYSDTPTFTDVLRVNPLTNGMYDYRYIETAAKTGIVRGGGGGRFAPDDSITRQDAAVMIARAANLKLGSDTDKSLTNLQKLFTDASAIDTYSRTSVEAVSKASLIEGKQNILLQGKTKPTFRFDPGQTFTRAEAAEVAIRVLRQQKKIPK